MTTTDSTTDMGTGDASVGVEEVDAVAAERPRRRHDERGANLVEYSLLLALIAIVCIAAVSMLGGETDEGPRGITRSADSIVNAGTP